MRVFSVPVSAPFLRTVIAALVDGRLVDGFEARTDPARLAQATLYLPTLRAGRMAREIFLDELKTDAVVLPRIVALGDIDEDELAFAQADLRRGIGPARHSARLGRVASAGCCWRNCRRLGQAIAGRCQAPLVAGGPASTLALADDLARLIDDMVTRRCRLERARRAGAGSARQILAAHAAIPDIAHDRWPAILAEHDRIEPAARRDLLIDAEAARLTAHRDGPVIAAGSTGSMPSTAQIAARRRRPAAGRRGAAGARYRSRRRRLAIDRRRPRMPMAGSPRSRHRTIRNTRCTRCSIASASSAAMSKFSASRRRMAAMCWYPRRCGLRMPPRNGTGGWPSLDIAGKIAARHEPISPSSRPPIPRWRRSRSRWRCARRGI